MILCPLPGRDWRITQRFPDRPEYYAKYGLKGHGGIDFAPKVPGTKGVIVYAPHEGIVKAEDFGSKGFGRHIYITSLPYDEAGIRRQSVLAHLAAITVNNGQYVAAGEPIGVMGTTGDSTNVHLHWGYRRLNRAGKALDQTNGFNGFIDVEPFALYWSGAALR